MLSTGMQEFKDVLSVEAKAMRQNHSSVWHTVTRVFCFVFETYYFIK